MTTVVHMDKKPNCMNFLQRNIIHTYTLLLVLNSFKLIINTTKRLQRLPKIGLIERRKWTLLKLSQLRHGSFSKLFLTLKFDI